MSEIIEKKVKQFGLKTVVTVGIVFLIIGLMFGNSSDSSNTGKTTKNKHTQEDNIKYWTCSMHPQIKAEKSGDCPICGMDLIPVKTNSGGEELSEKQLSLSPLAVKLASIETVKALRKNVFHQLRVVGTIEADEQKEAVITSWFPGRIDKLYYEVTGEYLKKGTKVAKIYSPEIYKAEQELIQAAKSYGKSGESLKNFAKIKLESSKKKLKLLGLSERQIKEILKRKKPNKYINVYSKLGGYIYKKMANEGMYVKKGTPLFKVTELNSIWVVFDVYESDLLWVKKGQEVEFSTEAFKGKVFKGSITFVDVTVNPLTRTVRVRANIKNINNMLKPKMFVKGIVYSKLDSFGDVTSSTGEMQLPLVIPASAPLLTGKRAVVYVEDSKKEGVFEGRVVVLGPKTDEGYVVISGLEEGEKVVVKGNFKIDSELQILAKSSMMYQEGEAPAAHNHGDMKNMKQGKKGVNPKIDSKQIPDEFKKSTKPLLNSYFKLQESFSHDKLDNAKKSAEDMITYFNKVKMGALSSKAHMKWMGNQKQIVGFLKEIDKSKSLEKGRVFFEKVSDSIYSLIKDFALTENEIYRFHCPMAFDSKGAYWLQNKQGTENPYYGSKMFKCGSEVEVLTKGKSKGE